ncbi:hypothetical protein BH10PSE4_BH10PSE4_37180 [soil metagenome]
MNNSDKRVLTPFLDNEFTDAEQIAQRYVEDCGQSYESFEGRRITARLQTLDRSRLAIDPLRELGLSQPKPLAVMFHHSAKLFLHFRHKL